MRNEEEKLHQLDRLALEDIDNPNRWAHRALGVVLAGGKATRLGGRDKALIEIVGSSMLDRCIDRLSPQVSDVIISANGDLSRFSQERTVIADAIPDFSGPLAGIHAAMRWAQSNAPHTYWILSVAADTPFFPETLVSRLLMAMGGPAPMPVLAQSGDNIHPTFGLWPIALADDLEAYLNEGGRKVRAWANKHQASRAIFGGITIDDLEIDPFFNVNNPEDIDVAEAIAEELALST